MIRKLIKNRKAISYGIVVALITIVAIASSALIAVWIFGAGAASTRKAAFEVVGIPLISNTTKTLSLTVKNIGGADAYILKLIVGGREATSGWNITREGNIGSQFIPRATTVTISVKLPNNIVNTQGSSSIKLGDSVNCQLITDQGTLPFTAYVTD
jgi:hypothetical protein